MRNFRQLIGRTDPYRACFFVLVEVEICAWINIDVPVVLVQHIHRVRGAILVEEHRGAVKPERLEAKVRVRRVLGDAKVLDLGNDVRSDCKLPLA